MLGSVRMPVIKISSGNGASYARASSSVSAMPPKSMRMLSLALSRTGQGVLHPAIEKLRHIIFDKSLGLAVCREVGKGSYGRVWVDWIGLTIDTLGHIEDEGSGIRKREVLEQSTRENQSG